MDIRKQIEWLRPDRILKLYDGEKNMPGLTRLLIIGVGRNGTDCLMRTKHIAEKRFNAENGKIRFIAIGDEEYLNAAEWRGSVLAEKEKIGINPDEAIYKYLNDPTLLSPEAQEWFDEGLKNYSPAAPKYGLQKRQCGRIALFHYMELLLGRLGDLINDFSENELPLEIAVIGNLGDAMFGGMVVDLGFILTNLFKNSEYSVKTNAFMFAGDTAQFYEKDARDLANCYANTIVTKGELDLFQSRRLGFSQKYTKTFSVESEKPPYNACYIAAAEETYEETIMLAAEKILSAGEFIYKKDDDADKVISYNMLGQDGKHNFRYLSYDVAGVEIPLGKIVSYLSVKLFASLCGYLKLNSVGDMQLGIYKSKVTPDAMLLASRAGGIPQIEYDEKYNPLFSVKSLKKGGEASKKYVTDKVDEFARLVKEGADAVLPEAADAIISACDEALGSFEKGPFYATEIIRKCLSELKAAIDRVTAEKEDADEQLVREEHLVQSDYRKLKGTPSVMAGNAARLYISSLSEYAKYLKQQRTAGTMLEFYTALYNKLNEYSESTLAEKIKIFSLDPSEFLSDIGEEEVTCVKEAFKVDSPEILEKLDKLVAEIPESTRNLAFKRMKMLGQEGGGERFAAEIVNLAAQCFGSFLLMGYNDFCEYFGVESTIKDALGECFERVSVKTPADDEKPLTRIICPKNVKQGDVAQLKASRHAINYIWNVSPMFNAAIVVQVKGGVRFDKFKDYDQWENMRYAYVNDSLKKHGIRIFKS